MEHKNAVIIQFKYLERTKLQYILYILKYQKCTYLMWVQERNSSLFPLQTFLASLNKSNLKLIQNLITV